MPNGGSTDQDRARSEAEFEKLQLEIAKLKAELANVKRVRTIDSLVRLTPLLTVLVAVTGFLFTIYQYRDEQEKNRQARSEQFNKETADREERNRRDKESAWREYVKPLLEKQQLLYFEASSAAATIVSSKNPEDRRKAVNTFWTLYWGPLVFVESREVSAAMVQFGRCLNGDEQCDDSELKNRSLSLTTTMQESILHQTVFQ